MVFCCYKYVISEILFSVWTKKRNVQVDNLYDWLPSHWLQITAFKESKSGYRLKRKRWTHKNPVLGKVQRLLFFLDSIHCTGLFLTLLPLRKERAFQWKCSFIFQWSERLYLCGFVCLYVFCRMMGQWGWRYYELMPGTNEILASKHDIVTGQTRALWDRHLCSWQFFRLFYG